MRTGTVPPLLRNAITGSHYVVGGIASSATGDKRRIAAQAF